MKKDIALKTVSTLSIDKPKALTYIEAKALRERMYEIK